MNGPEIVILSIVIPWVVIAAVVIGYPLVTGQIRVGPETLSRDDDPQAFWRAYRWSTVLFLCISVATGFGLHAMLQGKL